MQPITTIDIIIIFFIIWGQFGTPYYGVKVIIDKAWYENESKVGKVLTIFLGGPAAWLFEIALFIKTNFLKK